TLGAGICRWRCSAPLACRQPAPRLWRAAGWGVRFRQHPNGPQIVGLCPAAADRCCEHEALLAGRPYAAGDGRGAAAEARRLVGVAIVDPDLTTTGTQDQHPAALTEGGAAHASRQAGERLGHALDHVAERRAALP